MCWEYDTQKFFLKKKLIFKFQINHYREDKIDVYGGQICHLAATL